MTIAATLGSAALAGWLACTITRDRLTALFVALTYLTLADVLFYRGWLARELRVARCDACGHHFLPPRPVCPACWSPSRSASA